jgi:hypothetical protein
MTGATLTDDTKRQPQPSPSTEDARDNVPLETSLQTIEPAPYFNISCFAQKSDSHCQRITLAGLQHYSIKPVGFKISETCIF